MSRSASENPVTMMRSTSAHSRSQAAMAARPRSVRSAILLLRSRPGTHAMNPPRSRLSSMRDTAEGSMQKNVAISRWVLPPWAAM